MHRLTASFVAALAGAPLAAQSHLATPFTGTAATTLVGAVYFDLTVTNPAGVSLTALDLNCNGAAGATGHVEVWTTPGTYVGHHDDPTAWTLGSTAAVVSAGPGNATHTALATGFWLAPGTHGVAIAGASVAQRFTIGSGCTSTSPPGSCSNASFANQDLAFAGGGTTMGAFTAVLAGPRIWNGGLYYLVGAVPPVAATSTRYGIGTYASAWQHFADAAAAHAGLEGRSLRFTPSGGGYQLDAGLASYLPPTTAAQPVFLTPSDNAGGVLVPSASLPTPQGPQPWLFVHCNGVLSWTQPATTFPGTTTFEPTPAGLLGCNAPAIFSWHDYDESEPGSGRIVFEERTITGHTVLFVTWDDVENSAFPEHANRSTMQFQIDLTNGVVTIVWESIDADSTALQGSGHVIGYSPGGASLDPGPIDLAATTPLLLASDDLGPRLDANLPRLGTTWVLASVHVEPVAPIAFVLFGTTSFGPAGIDLAAAGAPGSRAYGSADIGAFGFLVANGGGALLVDVPANPVLHGTLLHAQTAAWTNGNALRLATSNGLTGRLGS